MIRINNITSLLSFFLSIPIIQSLKYCERFYLCKHNIRLLILFNLHEIEQTCFTDLSQVKIINLILKYIYFFFFLDKY